MQYLNDVPQQVIKEMPYGAKKKCGNRDENSRRIVALLYVDWL